MKNYLIAERYARALNELITDDSQLDAAAQGLEDLAETYQEHPRLQHVLDNPALEMKQRRAVLDEVIEAVAAPAMVARLARIMLERDRITLLPEVANVFHRHVDQRMDRVGATVTSAVALDDAQRKRLREALGSYSGKTVRCQYKVNRHLLGGVVTRMGGTLIDGSVRTRLRLMREALLGEERKVE